MIKRKKVVFPEKGMEKDALIRKMKTSRAKDLRWQEGKAFCLIYYPGREYAQLVKEAYNLFFTENALNPISFPSLRKYEAEVISMAGDLLHGDDQVTGSLTSGGTESILMAVKTARDYARAHFPSIKNPEVILPITAHPAFEKAFHYFDIKAVHIPVDKEYRADLKAIDRAVSPNTIMIIGSAPSYPHGIIDPIKEIAKIALRRNLLFHVDACIGGFMLPFIKKLDYPIPPFDFEVNGVTSISADIHKYGYAAKGASLILYKNHDLRRFQFSVYTKWPGGVYGSPSMSGSRPGATIAAAWAAINGIGKEGYVALAKKTMDVTKKLKIGIKAIPELQIIGKPDMSILAFKARTINMYALADELNVNGWHFERLQKPEGIHLTIGPTHEKVADKFLKDLNESVEKVKKFSLDKITDDIKVSVVKRLVKILPDGILSKIQKQFSGTSAIDSDRTAAMYGMMGVISGRDLDEIVLDLLDKLNSLDY